MQGNTTRTGKSWEWSKFQFSLLLMAQMCCLTFICVLNHHADMSVAGQPTKQSKHGVSFLLLQHSLLQKHRWHQYIRASLHRVDKLATLNGNNTTLYVLMALIFIDALNLKLLSILCCPLTNKDVQCLDSPSRLCSVQRYISTVWHWVCVTASIWATFSQSDRAFVM